MSDFTKLSIEELNKNKNELIKRYNEFKSQKLELDMTRGKPCPEQLDLSMDLLQFADKDNYKTQNGVDCRNYGGVDGIPEAKNLFSQYLEVEPDEIIVGGNASLTFMHDTFMRAMIHGVDEDSVPWSKQPKLKFLCPSPGYDRHFSICEFMGIEMITIEMDENGPDMDIVENLVSEDESIKGIWCVPKYSNPSGITYSDEVIDRLSSMKTKASDFRIFCDNAYSAHHLTDTPDKLKNILEACKKAGNPDRVYIFGSTAKITFAGGGVSMMAGSKKNIDRAKKQLIIQSIGPDKINQLRHVCFFKDMDGVTNLMKKHAMILKPKFDAVQTILERELAGKNIVQWSNPKGGYFVSINTLDNCAKDIVKMASDAGVKLTPAGATYPYKNDPRDRNIRVAPSFPGLNDINKAMELFAICIQIVSINKLLK